jgi:hypothetical protein
MGEGRPSMQITHEGAVPWVGWEGAEKFVMRKSEIGERIGFIQAGTHWVFATSVTHGVMFTS